ncbi:MAG: FGGY family carbohydrate kinase [Ilumatobacteraceae bacterium]
MIVLAIDAGTTGVRTRAFGADGSTRAVSYREFPQHFPRPGWVEHDALDIWAATRDTVNEVCARLDDEVVAIGITNQRETVVAFDRRTGMPLHRAIVWQDRRTSTRCEELAHWLPTVRARTGLVLDPYFSATKIEWLLEHGNLSDDPNVEVVFGTIDAFLVHRLTAGETFVTDVSNASRTMLYDIVAQRWDPELCALFGIDPRQLPDVVASSGRCGVTSPAAGIPGGIPVAGIVGDQQAALFGQHCFTPGTAKNTYGTGSFLLLNVGTDAPPTRDGLLTTIAWKLGDEPVTYALEGAVFSTGSTVQWLRDQLGVITESRELEPLAATVPDAGGVIIVPAFAGLGSPWWDPDARGTIVGLTPGVSRAHLARAVIDAMVMQIRDVVNAMNDVGGVALRELRVDGGAAVMDLMLQLQADALGVDVVRPPIIESTAMGAALLAGLGVGVWASLADVPTLDGASGADHALAHRFVARPDNPQRLPSAEAWIRAVERSRAWARTATE